MEEEYCKCVMRCREDGKKQQAKEREGEKGRLIKI